MRPNLLTECLSLVSEYRRIVKRSDSSVISLHKVKDRQLIL